MTQEIIHELEKINQYLWGAYQFMRDEKTKEVMCYVSDNLARQIKKMKDEAALKESIKNIDTLHGYAEMALNDLI